MSGFAAGRVLKERRILREPGKGTSDMAVEAVNGLLAKRGLKATDIDLLICATVTPDMVFPATANVICDKIGATNGLGLRCRCGLFWLYLCPHRGFKIH